MKWPCRNSPTFLHKTDISHQWEGGTKGKISEENLTGEIKGTKGKGEEGFCGKITELNDGLEHNGSVEVSSANVIFREFVLGRYSPS